MGVTNINTKTVLSDPAGNIETNSNMGVSTLTFTHSNGSNLQFGNHCTSTFNSSNSQTLTLEDSFNTTYGDSSLFTQGTLETRTEGDVIELIGASTLLDQPIIESWYTAYGEGIGSLKSQWDDNRADLTDNDYPTNTVFNKPSGASAIVVCPQLLNGTAENNKNTESLKEFEEKMMGSKATIESDATKKLQEDLNTLYDNINDNMKSLYSAIYKK